MGALDQRVPKLSALIALVAMIGVSGWQGYRFWKTELQATNPVARSVVAPLPTEQANMPPDIRLAELQLFGAANTGATPAQSSTENLPETNLRLLLRGVLVPDGDFTGSALIEDDKGNTEAYLVSDELPGNATLRHVFANRVIIERTGKLENLYFPESESRSGMDLASNNDVPMDESVAPPAAQQPRSQASQTSPSEQQRRDEIRRRLEQLRQRLQTN
ncbi:general secretion pathway protein GspC [Marinobacter fuscus]|uniref:General secretion pathway protein GspC n=1 Tax=Marinobacter fuscus TaxID=2109942 RepID=A0A2T1KPU9_9GAMM|nr:type II secretion system protein N [Marinobacter fuscus]PSF12179.1 general secretion pathway protein GspC [Marinobacter fuscus]